MTAPALTQIGKPLERSRENMNLKLLDPHEGRAIELDDLGESRRAKLVLLCSAAGTGFPLRTCKQRACPTCSQNVAIRNSRKALNRIEQMTFKTLVLITVCSRSLLDLGSTITLFKQALSRLRERVCFSNVRAGVGGLEPKLSDDKTFWEVHAHLVLDVDPALLDVARVHANWTRLINDRHGKFCAEANPCVRSPRAIAIYMTKTWDWSPPPGTMDSPRLGLLFRAMRGRRLVIAWGPLRASTQTEAT